MPPLAGIGVVGHEELVEAAHGLHCLTRCWQQQRRLWEHRLLMSDLMSLRMHQRISPLGQASNNGQDLIPAVAKRFANGQGTAKLEGAAAPAGTLS